MRKLTLTGKLRQQVKVLEKQLEKQTTGEQYRNTDLSRRIVDLESQVLEARRRTIPMQDGSELNFLPSHIESVEVKHDYVTVRSWDGTEERLHTGSRAVIHARGDLQYNGKPVSTTAAGERK